MDPTEPIESNGNLRMLTYQEFWAKACKSYGDFIAPTTFRRWVTDACLLPIKATYEPDEILWMNEWVTIAKRFPKGSPMAKKHFHQRMREQAS
jgi:hypothetical protein